MLEDCFKDYKGCQECQKFCSIKKSPASAMNPIMKPWPFRGWGIDLIGQVFLSSNKFVLVATDYFTKWIEAIPLKVASSANVIEFIFNIVFIDLGPLSPLQLIQGKMFTSKEFEDFAASTGFKLINLSPYCA